MSRDKGGKKGSPRKRSAASGETIRPEDLDYLAHWASGRAYVEGFVEPETFVNEMSIVLVDERGEHTRRKIGGPRGIDAIAKRLGIDIYDVEETGYPDRMRRKMESDRLIRNRIEQMERRAKFDQERSEDQGGSGGSGGGVQ